MTASIASIPGVVLRPAGVDDLDAIMVLETSEFVNDAWSAGAMRSELASSNTVYLVAEEADAAPRGDAADAAAAVSRPILGYAGLLVPPGAREADIQTIAVAPAARRRGIGGALVTTLLETARSRRVGEVFLEVRADNPGAQALYLGLGFEAIGVRTAYYQPDGVDAIVMRRRASPDAPDAPAASSPAATITTPDTDGGAA